MGSCHKCREKWSGANVSHCAGCHRTFGSVGAFDKHRRGMVCCDPTELGMEINEKGRWVTKMTEDEKIRMGFAQEQGFLPSLDAKIGTI